MLNAICTRVKLCVVCPGCVRAVRGVIGCSLIECPSLQTDEVIDTTEARIGLLGEWREVTLCVGLQWSFF